MESTERAAEQFQRRELRMWLGAEPCQLVLQLFDAFPQRVESRFIPVTGQSRPREPATATVLPTQGCHELNGFGQGQLDQCKQDLIHPLQSLGRGGSAGGGLLKGPGQREAGVALAGGRAGGRQFSQSCGHHRGISLRRHTAAQATQAPSAADHPVHASVLQQLLPGHEALAAQADGMDGLSAWADTSAVALQSPCFRTQPLLTLRGGSQLRLDCSHGLGRRATRPGAISVRITSSPAAR